MEWLLDIQDLTIAFGRKEGARPVVTDLSFQVPLSGTLGLVGESGSGKSLTALAVMGLLDPKLVSVSGTIRFSPDGREGFSMVNQPESLYRTIRGKHMAMVFQEPMTSLNPVVPCGRQVSEMLHVHEGLSARDARERVLGLFEEVRLPAPNRIWQAYPHELSGGQKQRVMIAMALACKPALLLADEPTTALDVNVQRSIIELLRELQENHGLGLLFISHDLALVKEICKETLVLRQGRLVEYGPSQQVFSAPTTPYSKGLVSCKPKPGHRPIPLPVVEDFLGNPAFVVPPSEDPVVRSARLRKLYSREPLLKVKNLEVRFNGKGGEHSQTSVKAVDCVSFDIYPGETLGLVGESGCGKTTLGRSILRLVEPSGGALEYKGQSVLGLSGSPLRKLRRKIQIIFQDPYSSLNPRMRIGDAIMEPMRIHGLAASSREARAMALDMLEKVQLPAGFFDRYPHQLSGGQRQRAGIARTLAIQPELVICDESVSALDVSVQAHILNLLRQLKEDMDLTYLFISHDLGVVQYFSDRVLVMNKGQIEESGEADALFANPTSDFTRRLVAAIPQ